MSKALLNKLERVGQTIEAAQNSACVQSASREVKEALEDAQGAIRRALWAAER